MLVLQNTHETLPLFNRLSMIYQNSSFLSNMIILIIRLRKICSRAFINENACMIKAALWMCLKRKYHRTVWETLMHSSNTSRFVRRRGLLFTLLWGREGPLQCKYLAFQKINWGLDILIKLHCYSYLNPSRGESINL